MSNALLGICIGASLVCIGAALTVVAKRLVVTEELEDDYPSEHPAQAAGDRPDRARERLAVHPQEAPPRSRRVAGGTLGLAALTPALSLGPVWDTAPLDQTPWRRGVRLVDEAGAPLRAADIHHQSFYTAFPEGADPELLGASLVVIRLEPTSCTCPTGGRLGAPGDHRLLQDLHPRRLRGGALSQPQVPAVAALTGARMSMSLLHLRSVHRRTVTYGPAGRPLPQLPLMIDDAGHLRAAGNFSARVGPSWFNVRSTPRAHDRSVRRSRPLHRPAHRGGAADAHGSCGTCSPITGRSC